MKISSHILHLPPHLSTTWMQISALYTKEGKLIVTLLSHESIEIPGLTEEEQTQIFTAYASFLEKREQIKTSPITPSRQPQDLNPPLRIFQLGAAPQEILSMFDKNIPLLKMSMDSIESVAETMQHNSKLKDSPIIPDDILQKISEITRIVASNDINAIPKPEPHCNCPHCQIARTIHGKESKAGAEVVEEEIVSDQDLQFNPWMIEQTGEQLYAVTSKEDPSETYHVFLGEPVGCTCGMSGCAHILAVLKS